MKWYRRCRIGGSLKATVKYHYVDRRFTYIILLGLLYRVLFCILNFYKWLLYKNCQVGSLAGAAHLLNDNTGDPRSAQREQKSRVESKGKSWFDFHLQWRWKLWKHGLANHQCVDITPGAVRKVTTGITGLWQPSVHSDVAFWFFDVGSSYP